MHACTHTLLHGQLSWRPHAVGATHACTQAQGSQWCSAPGTAAACMAQEEASLLSSTAGASDSIVLIIVGPT